MQAVLLSRDGFQVLEREVPEFGADELLIKTLGCGVCGGDLFQYRTRQQLASSVLLGHEASGTVVAVGDAVSGFSVGDRITALEGAYADYFVARPEMLVKLPDDLDPLYALGEPLACCVHACARASIAPGDRVAVIGCGFMGLICLQLARLRGAAEIVAIDPIEYRRAAALTLGADTAWAPDAVDIADVDEGAFDLVIEATGVQPALDQAGDLVKQHGELLVIGYHESNQGQRNIDLKQWNFKAITVINGHVRRDDEKRAAMAEGIDLLARGELATRNLVKLYSLDATQQAFEELETADSGLFKAVLVPDTGT